MLAQLLRSGSPPPKITESTKPKKPSLTQMLRNASNISTPPSSLSSKTEKIQSIVRAPRSLIPTVPTSISSVFSAPSIKRARLDPAAEAAAKTPLFSESASFSSRPAIKVLTDTSLLPKPAPNSSSNDQIKLTADQQRFVNLVTSGCCVFCTGQAGCGKSLALGHALQVIQNRPYPQPDSRVRQQLRLPQFQARKSQQNVTVTALTGTAALAIRGTTLHSFLGLRPSVVSPNEILSGMSNIRRTMLQSVHTLIIDEVSMLSRVGSVCRGFFWPLSSRFFCTDQKVHVRSHRCRSANRSLQYHLPRRGSSLR